MLFSSFRQIEIVVYFTWGRTQGKQKELHQNGKKTCFVTLQARVYFVQRCLYYTQCRLSLNEYFLSSATNAVALLCY